jgi:molybdenum cofactor cytidylyltransferase
MKLAAVVPAAGLSLRMGREKILLDAGGTTMLERVLATLARAGVGDRIVVLRPDLPQAVETALRAGARVVLNPEPGGEMLFSIRLGMAHVPPEADAFYVWPADHPAVLAETVSLLAASAGRDRVVLPVHGGRRGHPALIGTVLIEAIGAIPAGEGLRHLWRCRPEVLADVAVDDPGVLLDLDTPEDYDRWIRRGDKESR